MTKYKNKELEEMEFVENKKAPSGNNGGSGGSRSTPPSVTDDDGFINIPDGLDEDLPFN